MCQQGQVLRKKDVEKITITKQILARLAGQAYQISGSFLDPMLIGLKILFSQSCRLAKNWTEPIQIEEFVLSVKTFLTLIQKLTKNGQDSQGFSSLSNSHSPKLYTIVMGQHQQPVGLCLWFQKKTTMVRKHFS